MPKTKSIEELYQKKTQYEHILDCPDTYIGDPSMTTEPRQVIVRHDDENMKIEFKQVKFSPGLIKICDEIIVNARDQQVRNTGLTEIRMNINGNQITVYNDGEGIHTDVHPEFKIYVPELIFSHLLTSTNYDKKESKITGGKNGFGAKLTNIYSKYFKIETSCNSTKETFSQLFEDNMLTRHEPIITKKKRSNHPFTRITFVPDFAKFGLEELTQDIYELLEKRMYDLSACLPSNISVYFNDNLIKYNNLEKYCKLYFPEIEHKDIVCEKVNERWEVLVTPTPSDDHFQQVSFVNGIHTVKGGKHVDYVVNQITKKVAEQIKIKKRKAVKTNYIKDNLYVFINCTIVNPSFDSQTKEYLVTRHDKFGSTCEVSEKFIEKLCKTELVDRVLSFTEFKEQNDLKKTDGKKRGLIRIPKLEDANLAGTSKGKDCTMILTEGDSAKAFAISGLSIVGRDYYGVFPLRGKFINVRDKTPNEIGKNQEIIHLKQIMGLQSGKEYKTVDQLRYGKIMILTDADDDGRHIKGLIINFIEHFWPSLLNIDDFVKSFSTPVVKVTKGTLSEQFYTMGEYENWKDANQNGKGWTNKYYKGLGTSTSSEAKSYFKEMDKCQLDYYVDEQEECRKAIMLAFTKSDKKDASDGKTKYSDRRKEWLSKYDKNVFIENTQQKITFTDFINKDLIHFSNSDNIRSIPNIMDGLKPSQRKILYGCLKRKLYNEVKVSQLSGYISENTAYHHGEASLQGTIVGLAQNYVGSNNINILKPNGQFGTRLTGGKDHASSRYIYTELNGLVKNIFNEYDIPLLTSNYDDGNVIEPIYYVPIIPMILVNGTDGIGTGYSTSIPTYNPMDIINNIKHLLNDEDITTMKPWAMGYKGQINEITQNKYISKGIYSFIDLNTVEVTELPLESWTDQYKEDIENKWIYDEKTNKTGFLVGYENHSTDNSVKFILKFKPGTLTSLRSNIDKLEKMLRMSASMTSTNMHLYDSEEHIKKYNTVEDILRYFYGVRLNMYFKRREYLIKKLSRELNIIEFKIKFIENIMDETIVIFRKKKDEVVEILEDNGFPVFNTSGNIMDDKCDESGSYKYLTSMAIQTFTYENIEELKKSFEQKRGELNDVESKNEKELWLEDLLLLEENYMIFHNDYIESINNETCGKISKKFRRKKKLK